MSLYLTSLNYIRSLAKSLINITKGSSYVNKSGETISLQDKDQVASSKKETRDAASIYIRENVAKGRLSLSEFKNANKSITFTAEEWYDFGITLADDLRFIVTHLSATARAGIIAEGIIFLSFDEITKLKSDSFKDASK